MQADQVDEDSLGYLLPLNFPFIIGIRKLLSLEGDNKLRIFR
jgi:hypothetical protein